MGVSQFFSKKSIKYFLTDRKDGFSEGVYDSFNLALHVRDKEVDVLENRKKLANCLDVSIKDFTFTRQVHGADIAVVSKKMIGKGSFDYYDSIEDCDGMVTDIKGAVLCVMQADCMPVIAYDENKGVVGACHAGWRGTIKGIAYNLVKTMIDVYACNVKDIHVYMGPCIASCCFRVGVDVADQFREKIGDHVIVKEIGEKAFVDLRETNRFYLDKVGVKKENIEDHSDCTKCMSDTYFSYRKSKTTGLFLGGIMIEK